MQMVRILKVGNLFVENFPAVELVEVGQDQNGNPILEERQNLPQTEEELREAIKDTILYLQRRRMEKIYDEYEYNGLSDIQVYAQQNDSEAQALLSLYLDYDNGIWAYIDSLQNKTYEELLQDAYDLYAIEERIYQQSLQNNPLPGQTL